MIMKRRIMAVLVAVIIIMTTLVPCALAEGEDETAGEVMQDDWLESMAQETLCCMCARKPGTSDETARKLRRSIVNGRLETGKPVLLLDWDGDVRYLNNRISEYMTFGSVLPEGSTFPLQLG